MEAPVTLVAIEVPRSPQVISARDVRSMGEWAAGRHALLARWVRLALEVTDAQSIRLVTGQPDQAVFDLVSAYGVVDTLLSDWIASLSDRASTAGADDASVLIRGASAMADAGPLRRALAALRASRTTATVEPAVMPVRERLLECGTIDAVTGAARAWGGLVSPGIDAGDVSAMGFVVPVFEVRRLKSLSGPGGIRPGGDAKTRGFVWIEEHEAAMADGPLGMLHAEWICGRWEA